VLKWLRKNIARDASAAATPVADLVSPDMRPAHSIKRQGDEHVRAARYADAERCYRQVRESDADYPGALVMLGFVLRGQGRVNEAREVLEHAVCIASEDADGHYLLGSLLAAAEPRDAEIFHLQRAIELRPDFEVARRQLIAALLRSDRFAQAKELCEQSLAILPKSSELHLYRGNLHERAGDKASAIASCERALALNPTSIEAQQNLSRLLFDTEQFERAEASYRREIELTPEHFGPRHQLGIVFDRMGRYAEAIELFKQAILLNPNSGASYSSLGAAYINLDQASGETVALAHANYEKAVAVEPENSDLHHNLGESYQRGGRLDLALSSFDRAIELNPDNAKARWMRFMLWAPAFSSKDDTDSPNRSGFESELARFEDWWLRSETDGAIFVGEAQPFFLTYQEENNLALLKRYGRVCAMAMQRWLDRQKSPQFMRPVEKRIRLGIISPDIRLHSVWMALIKGWLQSFDRERFELVVFSLTDRTDSETTWASEHSDVFVRGPRTLTRWVAAIREQNCEILLYPAVGLHPLVMKLASLRLAPLQINTWGHPDTSGLPTLDWYVSAECFEPTDAQDHYSERLLLLPHLGNRIQRLNVSSIDPDFGALNINIERPILICPGMPFKYQPANDDIFVEIAGRVPDVQFVFFRPSAGDFADTLKVRISREFDAARLQAADHVRFIRWLSLDEFHCLLRRADVMLDTIGFSGYNTAVQAMECGLPLITREGRFLRGRLASGVLRRMNLQELIVQTKADYVNLVVRLVADCLYRAHIRHEIQQRRSVLFDDQSAMGPFQEFLESVARPIRPRVRES
jgi:protein O-GlcNAc transferase